jgi:two-component system sensor histidine kinase VicK
MTPTNKEMHSAVQLEHGRLTSLVNSMADGVIAVDEDVDIVLYNGAALNILDSNSDVQDQPLRSIFTPLDKEDMPVDITALVKAVKTPTINRDLRLKYNDGSAINLYLSIAPVHLGYGAKGESGYVLMLRDITREKSLEEERDEFISVVSHELRTPIAITEGDISNAQLIASKSGDPAQVQKALDEAHNQVLFLADMINDLSTLSRAERGVLKLEAEDIDVKDLLKELYDNYRPQASDKGLELKLELPETSPPLRSSRLYVREVLQNFITNSIKYTEQGSVTIGARAGKHGVIFRVADTGIGISKTDQEKVFDKFFRSEDYRTRATNGTGLGLYVTAKLAKLLNADIKLDSELNKGSTFSVTIPSAQE